MVAVPPMAISLDALTEVRVFRVNRGVVLRFSHFPHFLSLNNVFVIVFLHCDIFSILPMLFFVMEHFAFDLVM